MNYQTLMNSESETQPQTAADWFDWLNRQEDTRRKVYFTEPEQLIAAFRREQAITRDYEGREILELLQNANDAAADQGKKSDVLIELSDHGLIVANNLFKDLPSEGVLFPYLSRVRAGDRATEFASRCRQIGIVGVTLHSYRQRNSGKSLCPAPYRGRKTPRLSYVASELPAKDARRRKRVSGKRPA